MKLDPIDFSVLRTDIHSHLLPSIDDGSRSMEESLELISSLKELGFSNLYWPGRFEILMDANPVVIVDGAHNPYSMKTLVNTLNSVFNKPKVIVIFGAISGHDLERSLEPLSSLDVILIPVSSRHPMAIDSNTIKLAAISSNIVTTQNFENQVIKK